MSSKISKYYACYSVLDAKLNSTPQLIKSRFTELSKIYHPDNQKTGDAKKFMRIKNAYDLIRDAPLSRETTKNFEFASTNKVVEIKRVNKENDFSVYAKPPDSSSIMQMFLSKLYQLLKL